jgi:hypothetical protein
MDLWIKEDAFELLKLKIDAEIDRILGIVKLIMPRKIRGEHKGELKRKTINQMDILNLFNAINDNGLLKRIKVRD